MYQFINTDNTTGVHNIVENNLMYGNQLTVENGGSGLHFYLSSNIDIYNNTAVDNAFQKIMKTDRFQVR